MKETNFKGIFGFTLSAILLVVLLSFGASASSAQIVECWSLITQTTCANNASLGCSWDTDGQFCERISCFSGDGTNSTYCETTLKSFNQSCVYSELNTNTTKLCDPIGGDFFGNECDDFNGNSQGCYNTNFCVWNSTASTCNTPSGGFQQQAGSGNNPSCLVIQDQNICNGISGCTWNSGLSICEGNDAGIQCTALNKTSCNDFTLCSTCCNWNGSNCTTSFDKGCYDNVPQLAPGYMFCEDTAVFKQQAQCANISGSPWFMPCKWDNVTSECHFNNGAFGGSSNMDEISTELGCEAAGGFWKSEQYTDSSGSTKSDSWCEFKFGFEHGGGGNCDSACWSCEAGVSSAKGNTTTQAQNYCQNSALGYCEFRSDSNAFNGLGWCFPKDDFVQGGGQSCDSDCGSCEFLNSPQSQCQNSSKGCTWVTDTTASNGAGFCFGLSEKRCGNDCFSCYTQSECTTTGEGGNGKCAWDNGAQFCKPVGFSGEVCFDGSDNDNDGKVDCADADCATDKFCGGDQLGDGFGVDCPTFNTITTCNTNGCAWLNDSFEKNLGNGTGGSGGGSVGHCDFPGAQCFIYDTDPTKCDLVNGCSYVNSNAAFCGENETLADSCFSKTTDTTCKAITGCTWINDGFGFNGGRCELLVFGQCIFNQTRQGSQTGCEQNESVAGFSTQICKWTSNQYNPNGGFCDPGCFSLTPTNATCQTNMRGLCQLSTGFCEPDSFGGKCFAADGNKTRCTIELNATCSFFPDPNANNGNETEEGWCVDKGEGQFCNFMGDIPPTILGDDGADETIDDHWDLREIAIRDDFENFVLGASIMNFTASATCNGTPTSTGVIGTGGLNSTFLWYMDTDGNSTNGCSARDNSSVVGFEFSFKYRGTWDTALTEIRSSYQCVNGTWGAVPIQLVSNGQKMCSLINGGMAGIAKKELYKFKGLYNKSKNVRIYATVGNNSANDSYINDFAGVYFYSPGSFDFKFEDCSNSGGDADGDGISASNDPDCQNFLKFGFNPFEAGFQCGDNQDNDGDGNKDCADDGCKYDFACGGNGQVETDANDKTSPKITWLQVDTYPNAAFIMYDTNEPANGSIEFYRLNSSCKNLNKTVRDIGVLDPFVPDYKMWHDGPLDNYNFNQESLGYDLTNNTVYYYKAKICDINGNCAVSSCSNFTTKKTLTDCKGCTSTFTFPFVPKSGTSATDPLGELNFKLESQDGTSTSLDSNGDAGKQFNHTNMKNFNLLIENENATNNSHWRVKLVNASVTGKVSTSIQNFSAGSDIQFNSTNNGSFIGMSSTKCQELINAFRPKKLEIGIPGNFTSELWQCTSGALSNCTNKASNATLVGYNTSLNMTLWLVPADWGC